ncbi:hypothetical protein EYF80_044076 [Liparis tanakae]|uniref:Uncharacterized protein n=1 Tax=Liparis tanakae TaxID=230148 RepID=A0A4Z2FXW2_9TELE|nr:hypothetical protein EYF80_044076 [Liparis tanakae]
MKRSDGGEKGVRERGRDGGFGFHSYDFPSELGIRPNVSFTRSFDRLVFYAPYCLEFSSSGYRLPIAPSLTAARSQRGDSLRHSGASFRFPTLVITRLVPCFPSFAHTCQTKLNRGECLLF